MTVVHNRLPRLVLAAPASGLTAHHGQVFLLLN
jgi:hypothetical protein